MPQPVQLDFDRVAFARSSWLVPLERWSTGWSHPPTKKGLQIQKLEPILVARIEWI
jgi:hypothetical protein